MFNSKQELEKYSSAFTISDMEVFLFPELMYALVLGNIMSPRIWKWKKDKWFEGLEKMTFNRQLQRLKQYIMDHYTFNLDLDTWGLTTKQRELERFSSFVDPAFFSKSNALFGYEGDKFYFDMDIRRHFGLDKYSGNVIPYWKTETVEAMDAFRYKPGYKNGAGECVSLAALYAAALYIVLDVPLENIFLMATPLHSQNFIAQGEGVLTNNRRLVTKNMWFNGTELTEKARRALEKERVTIVSHISGYIHIDYSDATIDRNAFVTFNDYVIDYLKTALDFEVFVNFLRVHGEYRKYFQFEHSTIGKRFYITAEKLYSYEHGSQNRIGDKSRKKLLDEVDTEEFYLQPHSDRYIINMLEEELNGHPLQCGHGTLVEKLKQLLPNIPEVEAMAKGLCQFICVQPQLPVPEKEFHEDQHLAIPVGWSRQEIIRYLSGKRKTNQTADLAFYTNRQLDTKGWEPFLKACMERNPVSVKTFKDFSDQGIYETLKNFPNHSIYDDQSLATPDEVANFGCGDGIEKAICLANCLRSRHQKVSLELIINEVEVILKVNQKSYTFESAKHYQWQHDI